jgi:hypothetical protein
MNLSSFGITTLSHIYYVHQKVKKSLGWRFGIKITYIMGILHCLVLLTYTQCFGIWLCFRCQVKVWILFFWTSRWSQSLSLDQERLVWGVRVFPRSLTLGTWLLSFNLICFTYGEKSPVSKGQEAGWAQEPVWKLWGREFQVPHGNQVQTDRQKPATSLTELPRICLIIETRRSIIFYAS